MKRDNIVSTLVEKYDKPAEAVRSVATDIYYSGNAEQILADSQLVNKLFSRWEEKTTAEGERYVVNSTEPKACPVCAMSLHPIKLSGDRDAVWCPRHFVVFPIKPKKRD